MVTKMYHDGLETIKDIIMASQQRLRQVRGIGPKKSQDFYTNIRLGIEKSKLYKLMIASGSYLGSNLGKAYLRSIVNNIPDILTIYCDKEYNDRRRILTVLLTQIKQIGPKRAQNFLDGLDNFYCFLEDFPYDPPNNYKINEFIDGKTFVLTNIDDEDYEDYIIDNGGNIASTVNQNVDFVITGDLNTISTKTKLAFELNIPVYTMEEFERESGIEI